MRCWRAGREAGLGREAYPDSREGEDHTEHTAMSQGTVQAKPRGVVAAGCVVLEHCAGMVRGLDDRAYTTPSARLAGGTIGKHLRHVVDHFRAALEGREAVIDYDHRARNVPMESDRQAAVAAIGGVVEGLERLTDRELSAPVRVLAMLTGDGAEIELGSTLCRELHFAMHHAIHHQAMMRSIAEEFGASVDSEFGKAPSTVHFERGGG